MITFYIPTPSRKELNPHIGMIKKSMADTWEILAYDFQFKHLIFKILLWSSDIFLFNGYKSKCYTEFI